MKIENDLTQLSHDFGPYFKTRIMARIQEDKEAKAFIRKGILVSAMLMTMILFGVVFVQNGDLSLDAILGLSELDTNLNEYLLYF